MPNISKISAVLAAILAVPSFLILISWNALPGSNLYGLKRGLEKVPEIAFGNSQAGANYGVFLVDRRFGEADKLVSSNQIQGLLDLNDSIVAAKQKVEISQSASAKTALIANLTLYNQKLEQQKVQLIAAAGSQTPTQPQTAPQPTPTVQPTRVPTSAIINKAQPTQTTTTPTQQTQPTTTQTTTPTTTTSTTTNTTVAAITQTQQQITQTIHDLEKDQSDNKQQDEKHSKDQQDNDQKDKKKK